MFENNITVIIDYAVISPIILENITFSSYPIWWTEINEDSFEFTVYCPESDLAWVREKLTSYI